MEFERTTMAQWNEIERLIEAGQSDRQIARALRCRRSLVASIRRKQVTRDIIVQSQGVQPRVPPHWALQIDWGAVERDLQRGYPIKRIWEEVAQSLTSHPNFFKYVKSRFALLLEHTVTLREFLPGEYCEVDYAGDCIDWLDPKTGEVHSAHVFVGILCLSQKIFAVAHENEKKINWLDAHRRMFEFYGGCPRVVVPDCLRNGVIKAHTYDPDLNPDYVEMAKHYQVAIVPARARHPKDKALVENAVGILMRLFRFTYRRTTFTSLAEINQALAATLAVLNSKLHSRFKTSRNERFETLEKHTLKSLPIEPYSLSESRVVTLHADCTVLVDGNFYSAPHIYRGKELRVKLSLNQVEIFVGLERVALHDRLRGRVGERRLLNEHLPENSRAYRETTPQMILGQARFAHPELHKLVEELFRQDTLANMRRAQGLVRRVFAVITKYGRPTAAPWVERACQQMCRSGHMRVRQFEELLKAEMKKTTNSGVDRTIVRRPGNPMIRGHGTRKSTAILEIVPPPISLT